MLSDPVAVSKTALRCPYPKILRSCHECLHTTKDENVGRNGISTYPAFYFRSSRSDLLSDPVAVSKTALRCPYPKILRSCHECLHTTKDESVDRNGIPTYPAFYFRSRSDLLSDPVAVSKTALRCPYPKILRSCHECLHTTKDESVGRNGISTYPAFYFRSRFQRKTVSGWTMTNACLHVRNLLAQSTNSLFCSRIVEETKVGSIDAVVPEITGFAYISGINYIVVDPRDSLRHGFYVE